MSLTSYIMNHVIHRFSLQFPKRSILTATKKTCRNPPGVEPSVPGAFSGGGGLRGAGALRDLCVSCAAWEAQGWDGDLP